MPLDPATSPITSGIQDSVTVLPGHQSWLRCPTYSHVEATRQVQTHGSSVRAMLGWPRDSSQTQLPGQLPP